MRISPPRVLHDSASSRLSATVTWEEAERPPLDLYFEADGAAGEALSADASAFLCACAPVALRDGERRIQLDGPVCPRLRDGIAAALEILRGWYRPAASLPLLESLAGWRPRDRAPARAAVFVSGGVDSLFTLRTNRRDFPVAHPASFRDALFVGGHSFPEDPPGGRARDVHRRGARAVERIARSSGLELLCVRSNYARLAADIEFVVRQSQSACLAGVAHALSSRITSVSIAASGGIDSPEPWGSHPLLDPRFSTTAVDIFHDGGRPSRAEKARLLRTWPEALENMVVCFEGPLPEGQLNCGKCEKCLRTMTALEIARGLDRATAFPVRSLRPSDLESVPFGYFPEYFASAWGEMPSALREAGRADLARAVERRLREAEAALRSERRRWAARRLRNWVGRKLLTANRRLS